MNHDLFLKFIYAIFIGVFGAVLLVMFFAGLMTIRTIERLLPYIIGFNAALTGYNLISKIKEHLKYKRIWSVISGIIMVSAVVLILNIAFYHFIDGYIVDIIDFLILVPVGGVFGWLGSILAIKSMGATITK
jgi:uncharacterized membrane protein required for colicin V production